MHELFPIMSGLLVGASLGLLRPKARLIPGVAAAIILGTLATIVSGEYEISWEFLFIDIPLVAGSSLVSILALRQFRRRLPRQDITDR
jgi:hypothetical protein